VAEGVASDFLARVGGELKVMEPYEIPKSLKSIADKVIEMSSGVPSEKPVKKRSNTTLIIAIAIIVIVVVAGGVSYYEFFYPKPVSTITFYTWWSATGVVAMNHLFPYIKSQTGITIEKEISPGGGGVNAKYAILALIEAGKPPAMFQTHGGPEMLSYVFITPSGVKGFVNFTPYLSQWGVTAAMIPATYEGIEFNGTALSSPSNVHQGAQLFMNLKILKEYGLPIPNNISTLVYDTVQLYKHGVPAWEVPYGDGGWDQLNLWEDIFLSLAGPKLYNEMTYGTINLSDPKVQALINETDNYFVNLTAPQYQMPGEQSIAWQTGMADLVEGKAVFTANGNWLVNYAYDFTNVTCYPAIPPYTSWSNISLMGENFPGTQNYFAIVVDSIAVPISSETSQALKAVRVWSSYKGSELFDTWKASPFYENATYSMTTPACDHSYQLLKSTPENDMVYQLSDGGVFDDVMETLDSAALTLMETGPTGIPAFNRQLASAMQEEQAEWLEAAKLGLGYLGSFGHPFAGYYPPWVNPTNGQYIYSYKPT